jgi:hypothetical protein
MHKLKIAAKNKKRQTREQAQADAPKAPMEMDDGRVIYFARPYGPDLILMQSTLEATGMRETEDGQVIATNIAAAIDTGVGFMSFLSTLVSKEDYHYLIRRLRNPDDVLEIQDLLEAFTELLREGGWTSDRPTEPSSPSSTSPTRTGGRSTGTSPRKGSTRSNSRSTGSST